MKKSSWVFLSVFFLCVLNFGFSQSHVSVPLENNVYYIIENAAGRGLCTMPPSAKPWSENTVKNLLNEILASSKLSSAEHDVVYDALAQFDRKPGLDWTRGSFYSEQDLKDDSALSIEIGATVNTLTSMNLLSPFSVANYEIIGGYLSGDMGKNFSYNFTGRGEVLYIPLVENPKFYTNAADPAIGDHGTELDNSSYIPSLFPYSFSKVWEASIFQPDNLGSYRTWPNTLSFGYEVISELDASFVEDRLQFRFGRMRRDWGANGVGNNLVMNAAARPFMAMEGTARPMDWLNFSFLTGVLEYYNDFNSDSGLKANSRVFQNAFSLAMFEINYKNYFHFDFGSTTIWPKRFELGYLFPINSNFMYQNNVGDFDNLALFFDVSGQLPGVIKVWASGYLDEADFTTKPFFELDRNMYAYQVGAKVNIPWIPFGTFSLQYTKLEPYVYTHPITNTPWYGDSTTMMEQNYLNHGENLGYYLPPNSDELLVKIESMVAPGTNLHFQYQMIRHGVEYGPGRVFGSAYSDALTYANIGKTAQNKYFLHDGTYEWNHVLKVGGTYNLKSVGIPIAVYGDLGVVFVRYSGLSGGGISDTKENYTFISNDTYDSENRLIFSLGIKLYPNIGR
ncbi:MAG: hypothetical protein LBV20_07740 [Treponema sp.]|jgi:hypothetical protein|nr:hypothetical protein [Treponema sp.]